MGSNDLIRVAPESGPDDFFEVRLPSLPVPVRVEYSAIRDLRAGFDGNGDRLGLLLGSSSSQALSIQHCELLALSPATLSDPKLLQGALHQFIRARLQTPLEDAPQLLGCFRTQTTGWSGMREGDLDIAKRSFPGLDPLFLLIRTTQHRPWQAALYALEAKTATVPSQPALEFPFDEYLLRNGYLTGLVEAPVREEIAPPPHPVQPNMERLVNWLSAARWFNKTRLIAAGGTVAILLAGFVVYKWYGSPGRTEVAGRNALGSGLLKLKVTRSGKDFELSWDRLSAAVQQASAGLLTINDGALTRAVSLSGPQLREGQILYTPLFEELNFRLEVGTPEQSLAAESVQVLAWSGKQPADVLTVPPPTDFTKTSDPSKNSLARVFSNAATPPPAPIPPAKPAVLPAASQPKPAATAPPAAAPKSVPATVDSGKQTQPAKAAAETASVNQPAPANSAAPVTPAKAPETSPPVSERPPANTPAAQPPTVNAPKPVTPPATQVAPQASPQNNPQVAPQNSPAATPSSPPPAANPTIVSSASPAPVAAAPAVSGPVTLPVAIQRVAPTPPRNLPPAPGGVPRLITVRVMVDSAGSVQNAEIISSSPKGAFGEALVQRSALEAAKLWKFRPGQLSGKNVAAEYNIDFKFQ